MNCSCPIGNCACQNNHAIRYGVPHQSACACSRPYDQCCGLAESNPGVLYLTPGNIQRFSRPDGSIEEYGWSIIASDYKFEYTEIVKEEQSFESALRAIIGGLVESYLELDAPDAGPPPEEVVLEAAALCTEPFYATQTDCCDEVPQHPEDGMDRCFKSGAEEEISVDRSGICKCILCMPALYS